MTTNVPSGSALATSRSSVTTSDRSTIHTCSSFLKTHGTGKSHLENAPTYFNPRFLFSMKTCSSTGEAQMGQMYRLVVSLKSGSRLCLQFGHRTVSGFSSLGFGTGPHCELMNDVSQIEGFRSTFSNSLAPEPAPRAITTSVMNPRSVIAGLVCHHWGGGHNYFTIPSDTLLIY